MRRHQAIVHVLCGGGVLLAWSAPASAEVFMRVGEIHNIDTRFQFLGELDVQGSTPIDVQATGSTMSGGHVTDFAHGRVNYTGLGLRARQTSFNALDRGFTAHSLLRYDDLVFTSDDGAPTVNGSVQLRLDGQAILDSTFPEATTMSIVLDIFARSNGSTAAGQYSRRINVFGDRVLSQGLLTGYGGSGLISVDAPLTFSTLAPEKLEIELRIRVSTFSANPTLPMVDVDGNYVDTLRLNPAHLITFTSGLNPDVNSTTGEIMGNRIVIPGPAAIAALALGLVARRRR